MSNKKTWLRWLNLLLGGILSVLSFGSCKIHIFPPANLYGVPYDYYKEHEAELKSQSEIPDSTQTQLSEPKEAKKEDPE